MSKAKKKKLRELNSTEKLYTIVEGKIQYDYDTAMAQALATWSKIQIGKGVKPLFKNFYDQLNHRDQQSISVSNSTIFY